MNHCCMVRPSQVAGQPRTKYYWPGRADLAKLFDTVLQCVMNSPTRFFFQLATGYKFLGPLAYLVT